MTPPTSARACQKNARRRPLLLCAALVAGLTLAASGVTSFVSPRIGHGARGCRTPKVSQQAYTPLSATAGIAGFQGNEAALYTAMACFVISLPGVWSTITRTGQAKYIEKTYAMPGVAAGGLEMRSIAGGVAAYFKNLNYSMENSPQAGKIRFVGNLQGSVSQALYLTACLLGAFISLGFVCQALFPEGLFGLGPNIWYIPCITSPVAGWYYWGRAFRRDLVELQLELSDDKQMMTLNTLGDRETIELMQAGVRFQSQTGQLFQLMERGMEYQPGIFNPRQDDVLVFKEGEKKAQEQAQTPVAEAA